ncbi:porphobilinogen deaminase [Terrihabitans soli]|uniref:Porphobilinogen deaminase n=1 Tax=Terrihabitans soli TaxID=708113 RepID=A0A6S6QEH1_9HYPH|nr:hydroxymethylbilane synthase [Terrihabitans soli]BCJ89513.1 porphobilinogen deaminase [Terrihabitans soli]
MTSPFLRIGTRGSPLALWQARAVRAALASAHEVDEGAIEIVTIKTSGDQVKDRPLADLGGKGLFTKEIEEALQGNRVDIAVHSAKDVPTFLPDGLMLAGCLPRADVRDVLIAPEYRTLAALPEGAVIGTASVRRSALLKHLRPDLKTVLLRGNVETRLRKVESGEFQATLLALAGLTRLGLASHATEIFETETMLPACGQGAVAIEIRADDETARGRVEAIDHRETSLALVAERAMLAVLDGSCKTPIAGHAVHYTSGSLHLRGLVIAPDGSEVWNIKAEGAASDAEKIGRAAGEDLLGRVPSGILTEGPR